ncbi:SAF domain-containing protein [Kutzneria viridogrisea]|uniref:SAF domain-containing protein n=2 Tax=Kutzneria TaxID=43356 RepID=W5W7F4_9PSEU|nr:SAF domain-containing protein [Kutzneria albida]AHH94119.1 hypothetical protein KALB_744 [Kutzneria albida DSM 43870]MBA8929791.1 Flp pilus assembly protein CpaB [Kutzneria viridogrisea]
MVIAPKVWLARLVSAAGWNRAVLVRRAVAVLLVLAAALMAGYSALHGREHAVPVLVAARDVAPGSTLHAEDLSVRELPAAAVPVGALRERAAAVGQVLAGAARPGEPITDVRLVGAENTRLSTGDAGSAAVPVRLAEGGVAELLRPGSRVDVIGLAPGREGDPVLAADGVVVTVRPAAQQGERGRLVLVALPRQSATRVALASLSQPVTVTLR